MPKRTNDYAKSLALLSIVVIAITGGCNEPKASMPVAEHNSFAVGNVAVIDLDRVAQLLGQDKRITETLTAQQTKLQKQLSTLAARYRQQLSQQKQAQHQHKKPHDSQQPGAVQLASFQQQANAQLNQARQQVTRDLATHRSQLIAEFRKHIKPYAQKAARERGLSVILTHNDSVIYDYVASVDITGDVVDMIVRQQRTARVATPEVTR